MDNRIDKAVEEYRSKIYDTSDTVPYYTDAFADGIRWADAHPTMDNNLQYYHVQSEIGTEESLVIQKDLGINIYDHVERCLLRELIARIAGNKNIQTEVKENSTIYSLDAFVKKA